MIFHPASTARVFCVIRRQLVREAVALLLFASLLLQSAQAVAPGWWDTQNVLNAQRQADDYAAANVGQLKNLAAKAAAEMNLSLPGGAGEAIEALLASWAAAPAAGVTRDDYAALTLGQLKSVSAPFYDRLGLTYPWGSGLATDDFAVANVGQLKRVFAFAVPNAATLGLIDSDEDGFSDVLEFFEGTNPYLASHRPPGGGDVVPGSGPGLTSDEQAAVAAAYEVGLQERSRYIYAYNPSFGDYSPWDPEVWIEYDINYHSYWDYDIFEENPVWTYDYSIWEGFDEAKFQQGMEDLNAGLSDASLPEWEETAEATLWPSATIAAAANSAVGVEGAKAELRLVRRLKAGQAAPVDASGNVMKPEIRRTFLKVTTKYPDEDSSSEVDFVEFVIPAGADVSTATTGVLLPELATLGSHRIDLVPLEIRDASNGAFIADTAWIKAHRTDGSGEEPEWPRLEATISGLPSWLEVEWKLENKYPRRSGRDDLNIPATGTGVVTTGGQVWKIWQTVAGTTTPYFGGVVKVRFQVRTGSGGGTWREAAFKIRGENPDDARCKAHITSNQGAVWYAWAIAKHESGDSKGEYNQFANGLDNGGAGAHGGKGEPFYAPSEGDGWGIFQRDSSSGIPVTTSETWSWDGNMRGFLNDEYPGHMQAANNYVDSVKSKNPGTFEEPEFTIKGRVISGRDVLALTRYNGAQGRSSKRMLRFDGSRPSGDRWRHDLPNAPKKNQSYVEEILDQYNGG